jgi:S-formylglutathione hydrolase FrmB
MSWTEVHWRSEVLQKETAMQVLLPRTGRPPFPVLYLLHGLSDDSTAWLRNTRLEWYVRDLPLMVVLPDGYRGFYTDNNEGPAYATHLGIELVDFVDRHYRTRAERGGRAIGGLSMGGYGAVRIGLGYPERFCSVNSHSGALGRTNADFSDEAVRAGKHKDKSAAFIAELRRIFGRKPLGTRHDILDLAVAARAKDRLPHLLLDCGRKDYLLADSREFHQELKAAGVRHEYHEHAGAHDWDYWDRHIRDALKFHCKNLGVERKPRTR